MYLVSNFFNASIRRPVFRGKTSAENIQSSEFSGIKNLESDIFVPQNTLKRPTEFGTVSYLKDNSFEELRFKKPLTLAQALDTVQKAYYNENNKY